MSTLEFRRRDRPGGSRRRRMLQLAAATGVVGLLAAGCGEPEQNRADSGKVGSSAEVANVVKPISGPPKNGGTLIAALDAESPGFDPTSSQLAAAGLTVGRAIFDPLTAVDENLQAKPFLAEAVTSSNGTRTWDIKLRPGVKFHNGEVLDSAALKKYLEKVRTSGLLGPVVKPIQSVETVDPLTVRVQMDQPWSTFPFYMAVQPGLVAAPAMLDDPEGSRHPIGTGPFTFKSWETDKSLVVAKNPGYWRQGLPHLDAIDFQPIPDNQTRYKALQSGTVDVMVSPREGTIQDLAKDGQAGTFQVVRSQGDNDVNMLMMNTSKGPFADLRLRQAVAYATDRSQLTAITNSPPDLAADSVYVKTSPWYVDANYPRFDAEKAQALVTQIEAEKGPLTLTLTTVPDLDVIKNVQVIQQQLQQVGIDVKIDQTEQAKLISKAISGDFDFMTWRQFGSVDPDNNYVWWHSKNADGAIALNMARNKDPLLDQALDEGRASSDPAVRKRAYDTVQQRQAIDLPYLFTTHLRWTMGASNKLRNIEAASLPDGGKIISLFGGAMPVNEMWID